MRLSAHKNGGDQVSSDHMRYVWIDGDYIPWENATIHVRTQCVMRGASVFEGIRAYWNKAHQQLYLFKSTEHGIRLFNSMKFMRMLIPFSQGQIIDTCAELLRRENVRQDVHVRPMVYFGEGKRNAYSPDEIHAGTVISAVMSRSRLGLEHGIDCCVSSWVRISDDSMPPRVKVGANYQNSRQAAIEARVNGYDEAILLNRTGKVSEATLASVFIIRDGIPITPGVTCGILESITRATLMELFQRELDLSVVEREVDRTELYLAEEVYLCGTGAEILPVRSIDRYLVGDGGVGPLTMKIREAYEGIVRGANTKYADWLLPVYGE